MSDNIGERFIYVSLVFLLLTVAGAKEISAVQADDCPGVRGIITAYQPLAPDGIETGQCQYPCDLTASGTKVELGITAACDYRFPFGTKIFVYRSNGKANGKLYLCTDRGKLGRNHVDVAVGNEENSDAFTDRNACIVFTPPGRNDVVKLTATPQARGNEDHIFNPNGFVVTAVVTRMPDKTPTSTPTRFSNRKTEAESSATPIPNEPNGGELYKPTPDFIYNPMPTLPPDVDFVVGR